jgi:hypothetical protein
MHIAKILEGFLGRALYGRKHDGISRNYAQIFYRGKRHAHGRWEGLVPNQPLLCLSEPVIFWQKDDSGKEFGQMPGLGIWAALALH